MSQERQSLLQPLGELGIELCLGLVYLSHPHRYNLELWSRLHPSPTHTADCVSPGRTSHGWRLLVGEKWTHQSLLPDCHNKDDKKKDLDAALTLT